MISQSRRAVDLGQGRLTDNNSCCPKQNTIADTVPIFSNCIYLCSLKMFIPCITKII